MLREHSGIPFSYTDPALAEFGSERQSDGALIVSRLFSILNLHFSLHRGTTAAFEEAALMARFAKIDIGAGKTFDPSKLSPDMKDCRSRY